METKEKKSDFEKKVYDYITEHRLLAPGAHVIAGVSGGADSICMLLLLHRFRRSFDLKITTVHVHHGIRGESADRDARMTDLFSTELGIPCRTVYENVPAYARDHGCSEEEAGRIIRYQAFDRILEEQRADVIAVAHHAGDNTETVLWNLIRGAGLKGLSGMKPGRGRIIRPLLACTRGEIVAYLTMCDVRWCEDETNALEHYTRNKIRRTLIPAMEAIHPGASGHILAAAQIVAETYEWMEEEAQSLIRTHGIRTAEEISFPVSLLLQTHRALRMQVYLSAMAELVSGSVVNIGRKHLLLSDDLLRQAHGTAVQLPGGFCVRRRYDSLVVCRQCPENSCEVAFSVTDFPAVYELPWGFVPGGLLSFRLLPRKPGEKIPENMYTKWFDYDKITDRLQIRTRRVGDYIRIMPGYRKKMVKSFMIDEKIPRQLRDRMPLVADGSHILWIVGRRISEGYKVTEQTKTILQIQMRKEPENE